MACLRDNASARITTAAGLKHSVGSPAAMPSSVATNGRATKYVTAAIGFAPIQSGACSELIDGGMFSLCSDAVNGILIRVIRGWVVFVGNASPSGGLVSEQRNRP
jgi:hypothetical protein